MIKVITGLLIFILIGCSEVPLNQLTSDSKILAFGDSLTSGKGVANQYNYPSVLANLSGLTVINGGISGETTAQGLKRFENTLIEHQPDLILLLEGGNDFLRNKSLALTQSNLAKMIEIAQSYNIQLILLAVPTKSLFLSPADFYQDLAKKYDVVLIEDIVTDLLKNNEYKSDQIHFNQLGYQKLAQHIHQILIDEGAL
ncbi:arylesterase [Pseudoalteromonas sp. C2R02]|uniref:GDSL-type esterase/lipase family protein n=1 Tax=Pseudoalteromonas sp. C2R02 TaxID=2841565 RepID=UPI001C099B9A|nr:GDSL-type esterase/lipase family protein [Pseudoalteromonas sp. C2R02]MBU2968866.1 arylesterase [Pseudoalteromonas sp. C2R02]